MDKIKISVIVPVFNAEKTLRRCVDSLLKQTLREIEIILADDVSADSSRDIIEEYCFLNPKKVNKIFMEQNSRGSGVINRGVLMANGEYIAIVDNDDWLDETMLEKLYNVAIEKNADVVDCNMNVVDENGNSVRIEESNIMNQIGLIDDKKRASLFVNPGRRLTKIFHREMLIKNDIWHPEDFCFGDNYFMEILMGYVRHIEKVPEPLYNYYTNTHSITRSYNNPIAYDRIKSALAMLEQLKKRGLYEKFKEEIDFRFCQLFYVGSICVFLNKFKPSELDELIYLRKYMKDNFPKYRSNRYFRQNTSRVYRIVTKINDISPHILNLIWKMADIEVLRNIVKKRL